MTKKEQKKIKQEPLNHEIVHIPTPDPLGVKIIVEAHAVTHAPVTQEQLENMTREFSLHLKQFFAEPGEVLISIKGKVIPT